MKYSKERARAIADYIRQGETQRAAAEKAGINQATFYEWRKTKAEFADMIKKSLDELEANRTHNTKASLYKRAMGYEVTETETLYSVDADGERIVERIKEKTRHVPADTAALIFILTNRLPHEWRNRQDISGAIDISHITDEQLNQVIDGIAKSIGDGDE